MPRYTDAVFSEWPMRSLLYIPATKLDWVRKVGKHAPDGVVLDLEDAVLEDRKADARAGAREGINVLASLGIRPFVRINSLDEGGAKDIEAVVVPGLAGIVQPKVRCPQNVRELDVLL